MQRPLLSRAPRQYTKICTLTIAIFALLFYCKVLTGLFSNQESRADYLLRSEELWERSVARRRDAMTAIRIDSGKDLDLFPTPEDDLELWNSHSYFPIYDIWAFFPPAFPCPWEVERVGRLGEGGKWVCGMSQYEKLSQRSLVVYSFGIEQESSFEQEILERTNAYIFGYDVNVEVFGPQVSDSNKNRTIAKRIGIGPKDLDEDPPYRSLQSFMQQNGHSYIDILKIDVEGSEFASLDSFMDHFEGQDLPLGQLLIEIHLFPAQMTVAEFTRWWDRLEAFGLRPVWTEPNLLAVSFGPRFPCCSEYTFVNTRDSKSILIQ